MEELEAATDSRYLHFQVVPTGAQRPTPAEEELHFSTLVQRKLAGYDAHGCHTDRPKNIKQWINCDLRQFDYSVLGQ